MYIKKSIYILIVIFRFNNKYIFTRKTWKIKGITHNSNHDLITAMSRTRWFNTFRHHWEIKPKQFAKKQRFETGWLHELNRDHDLLLFTLLQYERPYLILVHGKTRSKKQTSYYTRTTDANWSLFSSKSQTIDLGRKIGQINFGAFGVFGANLSAPILVLWVLCPCFPLINHYFYKKIKHLYPDPKYLFGIVIWAAKN